MTDQLGLGFEAPFPAPPSLRAMQARTTTVPFDSPDHLFDPVWGGRRVLVTLDSGDMTITDERGRPMAAQLPELEGVAVRLVARSAILEAELVATDPAGRPDAAALARRLRGEPGPRVALLVSDLLYLDGRSLLAWPLERRLATLRTVLRPGDEVVAVPAIAGDGRALHDAVVAQGLAGVRARERSSPYLPGMRSRLWRFVPAGAAASDGPPAAPHGDDRGGGGDGGGDGGGAPVLALIRRLPLDFGE